jgi:hypothetical protein
MGLALLKIANDFMRLPQGSLREAKTEIFEIGPLHDFLRKKLK